MSVLTNRLDILPPNLVRVLAREGHRSLTNKELSEMTGLTIRRVGQISRQKSWSACTVSEASAFSKACGVDLVNQSTTTKFLKRGPAMVHVKRSPNRDYLLELLKL